MVFFDLRYKPVAVGQKRRDIARKSLYSYRPVSVAPKWQLLPQIKPEYGRSWVADCYEHFQQANRPLSMQDLGHLWLWGTPGTSGACLHWFEDIHRFLQIEQLMTTFDYRLQKLEDFVYTGNFCANSETVARFPQNAYSLRRCRWMKCDTHYRTILK